MRRFQLCILSLLLVIAAHQRVMAAVYYVGSCHAGGYPSINAAVTAVPAGSTINVCPGTYPEQVTISKALTLQGMRVNNSSQAIITIPTSALVTTSSIHFGTVAAQVDVTAGPVNISNITVDGTAGTANCPTVEYVGIYYGSNSSGTINEAEARNHRCNSLGIGMLAENGVGAVTSVKIENSNIHDNNYIGILTCSNQSPSTLIATITSNDVAGAAYGVVPYCNVGGVVSGNIVAAGTAISVGSTSATVSGNTVTGGSMGIGIQVLAATSVTSNNIFNSGLAVDMEINGASIQNNLITNAFNGIAFNCYTGTVSGNTINGATTGFDFVPSAFAGANKFYNVATVRNAENCH
jgi:hypothetical protein